jgi:2-(1,2-epoxy-1,2-dihydrophenyl)acetyl-CoA isomerase
VLAADIVVLERSVRLRSAYSAIGLTPDGGMSWTLPRAIGTARAMDMLLTNRPMDAAEALAAGLASRVVEDGTATQVAAEIAREIAIGPARALAATRALVRAGRDRTFAAQLDAEQASISAQAGGPEGREGVAAFLGRRPPEWISGGVEVPAS